MGYYTYFNLDFKYRPPLDLIEQVPEELRSSIVEEIYSRTEGYVNFDVTGSPGDTYKWYDWQDDMLAVSQKFPHVLLILNGDGEDSEDKWVAYFLDGKSHWSYAEIVYEDFDETKLTAKKENE